MGVESSAGEYIETSSVVVASGVASRNLLEDVGLKSTGTCDEGNVGY